jgi:glycosyl transferase family 25
MAGELTVVINLEHRSDRRAEMQKQLSRICWSADFFAAIQPTDAAEFPSIGARGCFLSHLGVLRKAREAGVRRIIILEDDVSFVPNFASQWQSAIGALERLEWSIFYPGHTLDGLPSGLSVLTPATGVLCSHFMVINGKAIAQLVEGLETILSRPTGHPLGSPMHVDGAYSTIRMQNHSLTTYAYSPVLGYQRPSRTDVGDLKWFDRVAALEPFVHFARRIAGISRARYH